MKKQKRLILLSMAIGSRLIASPPQYIVIDLGTIHGDPNAQYQGSAGYGINNIGQVTGDSDALPTAFSPHAFLYSKGKMINLGTLDGDPSGATSAGRGINDSGQVTGTSDRNVDLPHAYLYSAGTMTDLGTLGGRASSGFGINNRADITGLASLPGPNQSQADHPFLYSGGAMQDLGTLGSFVSASNSVNDFDVVTGGSQVMGNGDGVAFFYSQGHMTNMGTLGGKNSEGKAINNFGQITGWAGTTSSGSHAFSYSINDGKMRDIGAGDVSVGNSINSSGQIVGQFISPQHGYSPFLYSGGQVYDLNDLAAANMPGFRALTNGYGINDYGWITGYGSTTLFKSHAFLAKPVSSVPGPALNISTRLAVGTGENVLIAGFIVSGNESKKVIFRGIGPSLVKFGIQSPLADPFIELHDSSGNLITSNDDWKQTQQTEIEASGLAPTDVKESAIIATLVPGSYTVILHGTTNAAGVGLIEGYDLQKSSDSTLANISSRGFVDNGENVMIAGFILGNNGGSGTVLIRGIGPSLRKFGVANALQDPFLELHDSNGAKIVFNDNWKLREDGSSQQAQIETTGIPPTDDRESAILATLVPGSYTAVMHGATATFGVGSVELYHLK